MYKRQIYLFSNKYQQFIWGWILEHTLTYGTAKNGDLANASLNFVPNVKPCEFTTSFEVIVNHISVYIYVCRIVFIIFLKVYRNLQVHGKLAHILKIMCQIYGYSKVNKKSYALCCKFYQYTFKKIINTILQT